MALALRTRTIKLHKTKKEVRHSKLASANAKFKARTKLGRDLLAIRAKIKASGIPLLSLEEINRELGRNSEE